LLQEVLIEKYKKICKEVAKMKIIMKAIITIVPADTAVIGGFN